MKEIKRFTSHNGTVIRIFDDGGNYFVPLRAVAQAVGYSHYQHSTLLGAVLKNSKIPIFSPKVVFFVKFLDCFRLLENFLKAYESTEPLMYRQEEFDFNAKKLLEQFRKIDFQKSAETFPIAKETESEEKKLESETMAEEITTLTEADIEDIGKRADLIKNVFDVPKSAALQATVKLKAEEIGRNLAPLIELVNKNYFGGKNEQNYFNG